MGGRVRFPSAVRKITMNTFENTNNSRHQGDVGVATTIAFYVQKGYIVSVPLTENTLYDIVVDKKDGNGLLRVQCKTTTNKKKSGSFEVAFRTSGGNQSWNKMYKRISSDDVELVTVLTSEGTLYELPPAKFHDKATLALGKKDEIFRVASFQY